jgi:hypothetical protein
MTTFKRQFGAVIVGGGPAGLAVLLAAHKDGTLTDLLRQGLLIVEQGSHIGKGLIGNYEITSDSTGYTFVDPLRVGGEDALHRILETPIGRKIAAAGPNAIPLCEAGELLALVGKAFESILSRFPECAVMTSTTAEYARLQPDGSWLLAITDANGRKRSVEAERHWRCPATNKARGRVGSWKALDEAVGRPSLAIGRCHRYRRRGKGFRAACRQSQSQSGNCRRLNQRHVRCLHTYESP